MPFNFIGAGVGAILLLIGVLAFMWAPARRLLRIIPFGNTRLWAIIFIVVGFMVGGWGVITSNVTGFTASVTGDGPQQTIGGETMLDFCEYSTGVNDQAGTMTMRADPNSVNRVFVDIKNSTFGGASNYTGINVDWNCKRQGSIHEDGAIEFVVKGQEFRSDVSTSDTTLYNIITTTTTPSNVWAGDFRQTAYLKEGTGADATDTYERLALTFAEGESELVMSSNITIDRTAYNQLDLYSQKDITFYERTSAGDNPVGYVTINVIA